MIEAILTPAFILSLVTTACSLYGIKLQGDKNVKGFYFGIAVQVLWIALALVTGAYGLIVTSFAYALLYLRGIRKWRKESKAAKPHLPLTEEQSAGSLAGAR